MKTNTHYYMRSATVLLLLFLAMLPVLAQLNDQISQLDAPVVQEASSALLGQTEDMGQEYIDSMIFLGESTTYGLWRYGLLKGEKNTEQVWTGATVKDGRSACSGTLSLSPVIDQARLYFPEDGSAMTLAEAMERKRPKMLVITLGLNNGASYYSEDQFKYCYRRLLDVAIMQKDTKIILQSLFPVAESCTVSAYTPDRIILCNRWIYDMAEEYGLKYLDTFSALCDAKGYLLPEYDNGGDGIHLNDQGLLAVIQYIRTHGYREENI